MIPVALLTWLLDIAVEGCLWLVGMPVVGWLSYRANWRLQHSWLFNRDLLQWAPSWAFLWGNLENGVTGPDWYALENPKWSQRWRAFVWSAWRNPTCNLRFIKPFGFLIDPAKVHYVGNCMDPDASFKAQPGTYWYFAWHGLYTGFWLIYRGWQFRIGWKVIPKDIHGLAPDDYRRKGCGTALQLQRK